MNPPASAGDMGLIHDLGRSYMLRATKPVHHIYWAYALEPMLQNEKLLQWEAHAQQE